MLRKLHESLRVLIRQSQGLLAIDVLAGVQCLRYHVDVRGVRCQIDDNVYGRVSDQLVGRGVRAAVALLGQGGRTWGVDVRDAREVYFRIRCQVAGVLPGYVPGADDAKCQLLLRHGGFSSQSTGVRSPELPPSSEPSRRQHRVPWCRHAGANCRYRLIQNLNCFRWLAVYTPSPMRGCWSGKQ